MTMKRTLTFLTCILAISLVSAALPPAPYFCERQGYQYQQLENGTSYCLFDDGEKCESWEFVNGRCGQNYLKEFPCVEKGQAVFNFEECCGDLEPYLPRNMLGQPTCQTKQNSNYYYLIPLIFLAGIIYIIYRLKKKK
jgi:Domain of unknown function (DUF333)